MRRCLTRNVVSAAAVFAGALSLPSVALADECPPGSWFCGKVDVQVPGPQIPAQPPVAEDPETPPPVRRRPPPPAQPPVVVYQPVPNAPPPQVIVVTPGYGYGYGGPYSYQQQRPRPPVMAAPQPRWQPEFGLNMRVEGVALGHPDGAKYDAGLGGVGLSLRYRPVPHFAFDLGVDFLAGTDYNGFSRMEVPVSLNGILYVNPRSRVQFYFIGGGMVSRAQVRSDQQSPLLHPVEGGSEYGSSYTYLGGQGGAGFEFRISRRVALDLDGIGFVRKRIDGGQTPEFVDAKTGQTTDVSGGGLFRGGINFWW